MPLQCKEHDYDYIISMHMSVNLSDVAKSYEVPQPSLSSEHSGSQYEVPGLIADQYETITARTNSHQIEESTYDTPVDTQRGFQRNTQGAEAGYDTPMDAQALFSGKMEEKNIPACNTGPGEMEISGVYEDV